MQDFDKMTVKEIRIWLEKNPASISRELLRQLKFDSRKGVQNLSLQWERNLKRQLSEGERLHNLFQYELALQQQGYRLIAGVDEAGRGPLAGPVVAAAVILPLDCFIEGLDDSKKLTSLQRDRIYQKIVQSALSYGIGQVNNRIIDQINIAQATYWAMRKAIESLTIVPDYLLVDGATVPGACIPQRGIIKGDQKSASIAAASILAKVTRDGIMEKADLLYPGYGFAHHKGYGTKQHLTALKQFGITPIHRKSYEPVHQIIAPDR